jgi:predicted TIM-barrel fold metal-dependent hydrolase
MDADGVSAEILYPTMGLRMFHLADARFQEALFAAYNDWIAEYCRASPGRLVGLPMISLYNVDHAVKEVGRCRKMGLHGALIWLVPPPELPFPSAHYEPFWDAVQALDVPINCTAPDFLDTGMMVFTPPPAGKPAAFGVFAGA